MADFKDGETTEKIIGAAFRVHRVLGNGFREVIYQRERAHEFNSTSFQYVREFEMSYLEAPNPESGLLLNFDSTRLEFSGLPIINLICC
jgi:hypothetical protein